VVQVKYAGGVQVYKYAGGDDVTGKSSVRVAQCVPCAPYCADDSAACAVLSTCQEVGNPHVDPQDERKKSMEAKLTT